MDFNEIRLTHSTKSWININKHSSHTIIAPKPIPYPQTHTYTLAGWVTLAKTKLCTSLCVPCCVRTSEREREWERVLCVFITANVLSSSSSVFHINEASRRRVQTRKIQLIQACLNAHTYVQYFDGNNKNKNKNNSADSSTSIDSLWMYSIYFEMNMCIQRLVADLCARMCWLCQKSETWWKERCLGVVMTTLKKKKLTNK